MTTLNRGSEWLRWDVHIHTPGTALANQYPAGSWDEYVARVNRARPAAVALGVTDYLSLRGYKSLRERWIAGKLPGVRFIFPNVELRVSPPTKKHKGVNIHLLVDPSEDDHIERVEAALGRLTFEYDKEVFNCDERGLVRLGKRHDPSQLDDTAAYCNGVNECKIDFTKLRDWLRGDPWLERHSLIAVSNNENDGVLGLSPKHGYAATIEEMYRLAHMVLSGSPNDRRYWLGEGVDSPEVLTRRFGGPKPCLHGCDAHDLDRVLLPDGDRYCWIRAEPSFEGLRQVVFEPRDRVHVGADRPARAQQNWIRSVSVKGQPWFPAEPIPFNEGLVAIIGPRGSGKTALADLVAHAADAFEEGPASFLNKAMPAARRARVEVTWADRDDPVTRLVGDDPQGHPAVRYLSQHFVEQLCSADGASERLISEIEHVVFEALDQTDRLEASSFEELRSTVTESSLDRIQSLRAEIAQCSEEVAREQAGKKGVTTKRERLARIDRELDGIGRSLAGLVLKGKEEKVKTLQELVTKIAEAERTIAGLKAKAQRIRDLGVELDQRDRSYAEFHERLKIELRTLGVAEGDLDAFRFRSEGDFRAVLASRARSLGTEIASRSEGSSPRIEGERPLAVLRKASDDLRSEIGGETLKERQFLDLQQQQKVKQQERQRLETEIAHIGQADSRIKAAQVRRFDRYAEVFEELGRQREALDKLYKPLADILSAAPPERKKLEFFVRQVVDIQGWANRGEDLLDLRKKGEFAERGSLAKLAETILGDAWRSGDVARIRTGMSTLLDSFKGSEHMLAPTVTLGSFAEWLFSTEHVRVTYGIRYEGTDVERLSPGTRGIVLLILYLALDTQDSRPLIIDQPEENLDPQSVFEVLSGYFRETRKRRQVIVVTHNPNLVVNTDSDQVIIARAERVSGGGLPRLGYESGGLDSPEVREQACRILEGGERAFRERERRYALGPR